MLLTEKRMSFGDRQRLKARSIMHVNEIRESLIPDEFARKVKVVHKYAKERRISCQENSYRQATSPPAGQQCPHAHFRQW